MNFYYISYSIGTVTWQIYVLAIKWNHHFIMLKCGIFSSHLKIFICFYMSEKFAVKSTLIYVQGIINQNRLTNAVPAYG
jgi:hypothetical protein